jgi:hypothetical protein
MNLGTSEVWLAEFGFGSYNDDRVSDPRGLSGFLAAGARVALV